MSKLPFPLVAGFSARESLSLYSDGPLPSAWWRAAAAHDAAHPPPRPAARIRTGSVALKAHAVIAIMATAMEKAAAREGRITRDELMTLGLTSAEVETHARAAFRLALTRTPGLAGLEGLAA
jgi:hypothetical protein